MTEHSEESEAQAVADQINAIFNDLTPAQMIQNDIDTAKSARELRKISHAASHSVCVFLDGVPGLTKDQKKERLETARDILTCAAAALDKAIDMADKKETK